MQDDCHFFSRIGGGVRLPRGELAQRDRYLNELELWMDGDSTRGMEPGMAYLSEEQVHTLSSAERCWNLAEAKYLC